MLALPEVLELWGEWRSHTVLSCSTRSLARNHSITAKHYQGPQGYPDHGYLWSITRRKGNWNYRMKQYYSTSTIKQQYTVTERTVRNVHQWLNIGSLKIGLIKSSRTVARLQDTISSLGFIYVFPLFPILVFLPLIINWKYKHKDEGRTQALTASLQKKNPFICLAEMIFSRIILLYYRKSKQPMLYESGLGLYKISVLVFYQKLDRCNVLDMYCTSS